MLSQQYTCVGDLSKVTASRSPPTSCVTILAASSALTRPVKYV